MKPARLQFHQFHLLTCLVIFWAAIARGQFTGPYDLTPPSPSFYTFSGTTNFGGWTAEGLNQTAFYVFSTGAPGTVELNTGRLSVNNSCIFYTRAAAAGAVSFKYTTSGISSGLFGWFDSGSSPPAGYVPQEQYLGSVPDLVSNATASFSVAVGDYFGFTLSIPQGMGVNDSHARDVIIENFAAPRSILTNNGNVGVIAGPITNSSNNHQYYLLQPSSWTDAEATAVSMGGHLTTLNDGGEHDWVMNMFSSFGGVDRKLWIGLYDPQPNVNVTNYPAWWQQFVWTSGQSATALYLRWPTPGINPANGLYVYMLPPDQSSSYVPGEEVAADNSNMLNGVIEVPQQVEISSPPQSISVGVGCTARMSVLGDGNSPLSYQWQFMGSNLSGATSSVLSITNVQPDQAGPYTVVVSNASGSLTSAPAVLTVTSVVLWGGPYTVPASATDVVAIAGGSGHALALRADGTVVAWGDNRFGQASVPAGLNAVAVAAGSFFSLALCTNGTVVGWGADASGQIDIPAGLDSVIAISGKGEHSLALKADSSLVAWGSNGSGESNIPFGLDTALAIAAGGLHSLALKADGTVVAWGDNSHGQTSVPANLTNVVAIAAGIYNSLALKADGSLVAWGDFSLAVPAEATNIVAIDASGSQILALKADGTVVTWGYFGRSVPLDLPNVVGIAADDDFLLALVGAASPHVCVQPYDRLVPTGEAVSLFAKCVGLQPIAYQWRLNGVDIPGATSDTYSISSTQLADAGAYALVASNALGMAATRAARLGVYVATNRPPQLGLQTDRTINARSQLVVTNSAIDPDLGERLTYQLITSPAGATIDSTGVIRWTPSSADAPGANVFTTVVTDDGVPSLSATNSFTVVLLDLSHTGPVGIMAGPLTCSANHHQYYLLNPASWTDAEATAVAMGGHLVTIRDQDEQQWLTVTFLGTCGVGQALWIGLSDPTPWLPNDGSWAWTQHFMWASGEPVTFFCWSANPTITSQGVGRIKWVHLATDPCAWAEEADATLLNAVVEIPLNLEIITQPQNSSVGIGRDATLSVVAGGTSGMAYQWQFMGTNLPGATDAKLVLTNAQPSQSGPYDVIVSNAAGTRVSDTALLSVQGVIGWGISAFGVFAFPATVTNVSAISAGSLHALALRADGSVIAWGDNRVGQTNVPETLTNVVAIAAGDFFSLALQADGELIGWGDDTSGQIDIPADLTNVVAIAAGGQHCLAVRADGTIKAWGSDAQGESDVPAGLTNVTTVAAGSVYSVALRRDGTLVSWGNYSWTSNQGWIPAYVPAGLTNVVSVAAGSVHSVALRADGSVMAWGYSVEGDLDMPPGLSNVVAISAGDAHSLALKADGTVVGWGGMTGDVLQPQTMPNVVAVASGGNFNLALLRDGAPHITIQPSDDTVSAGAALSFCAKAVGIQSMAYQWKFNGAPIAGATADTYAIPLVRTTDAGTYEVAISNQIAVVVSRSATLAVSSTASTTNANQAPVLPVQTNRIVDELSTLVVTNTAGDASVPPSALSYELLNPPLGAAIDSTGIIRWTPTDAQAPGTTVITTVVSDSGIPGLSATNSFTVMVNQINTPPTLPGQAEQMISALSDLVVTNAAFNPVPASGLSYQLVNPPPGALIDRAGVIRWTPTRAQGPGTNTITTVVTLASIPRLSDRNDFTVIVSAPMLLTPPDYVVNVGQTVTFTNIASDNDPERKLAFTLEPAPTGASITSDTGVFNWRPPVSVAGTTNQVLVRVTDDSPVALNDSRAFTITVNPLQPVALVPRDFTNGQFRLRITGPVGPDYILQATTGLTNWSNLRTSSPVLMPFDFADPTATSLTNRLYRLRLGP